MKRDHTNWSGTIPLNPGQSCIFISVGGISSYRYSTRLYSIVYWRHSKLCRFANDCIASCNLMHPVVTTNLPDSSKWEMHLTVFFSPCITKLRFSKFPTYIPGTWSCDASSSSSYLLSGLFHRLLLLNPPVPPAAPCGSVEILVSLWHFHFEIEKSSKNLDAGMK